MDTFYALLIFVAMIFIIYQADRLMGGWYRNRGSEKGVETEQVVPDELFEPTIEPVEPLNSTTKDEMIHDLAEENARLLAEVDRLRGQIAVLLDGDESHRVE